MSPLALHQFRLRTFLMSFGVLLLCCVLVGYALFQARFILSGPQITFMEEVGRVQSERVVTITGTAENITFLSLNGREIYTDKNGYFKEALVLENGYTIATLSARDRYGRTREYEQTFVYAPAVAQN